MHQRRSDLAGALLHHRLDLRLSRERGDALGRARALANLGETHEAAEEGDRAAECYEEGLQAAMEADDAGSKIRAFENLGEGRYRHCLASRRDF